MAAESSIELAKIVMARCDELALLTDELGKITRIFHSLAMQSANRLVGNWMSQAGLEVWVDPAFNLWGRLEGVEKKSKTLLLGSHLDTVRDAGKYDGPLGVLIALAAVEKIRASSQQLPFHVEIVGFSDEEGVRYQTTYLGSRAIAGCLTEKDLFTISEKGIELAVRSPDEFFAYAEVHIEQGPVLEEQDLSVCVVTSIASQERIRLSLTGAAGHAGTTPMHLRRDALCGAAEFICMVEKCGILATVGAIDVRPGASNVIPGFVELSIDLRDQDDETRAGVSQKLKQVVSEIAVRRSLDLKWEVVQQTPTIYCDRVLTDTLRSAVAHHEKSVLAIPSGAGHDAAAVAHLCPISMLFVRCKGGVSHNPAESVKVADVAMAIGVLVDFILLLASE